VKVLLNRSDRDGQRFFRVSSRASSVRLISQVFLPFAFDGSCGRGKFNKPLQEPFTTFMHFVYLGKIIIFFHEGIKQRFFFILKEIYLCISSIVLFLKTFEWSFDVVSTCEDWSMCREIESHRGICTLVGSLKNPI
jgi:hypothetical protein